LEKRRKNELVKTESPQVDEDKIESELKGNTLRVYWHLLRSPKGVVGVRETQKSLGFSSPALAVYHLEKLAELRLIEKVRGEYHLVRVVNVGALRQFVKFGGFILPRYILYATMFTTLLLFYVSQLKQINFHSAFALIFGIIGTAILWYETVRAWRQKP